MENSKFENKGKLWFNSKKNKDTQPDWTGKANWKGQEFEISMWYNESKVENEQGTFSLILKEPYNKETTSSIGNAGVPNTKDWYK
jgi:hypothetical protein